MCPVRYDEILSQKALVGEKKVLDYGFNDFYYNVDSFSVQYHFLQLNLFQ